MELLVDEIWEAALLGLAPVPRLTVSQWADKNRLLTTETSAEPGTWRTSRVPYLKEIMDSLGALDPCEIVVLLKAAQVGATEAGLNWIGYSIEHDPGPMLLVVPNFEFAKSYSKRRIDPMLAACPALRERVVEPGKRDSRNTIIVKGFPGGTLRIGSAMSASSLSSDPMRRIFFDEADRYPRDVEGEGQPLALAKARTTSYPNRKIFMGSTPGLKADSFIEPAFLAGDMRRFFVPCPHCGEMDYITWNGSDPFDTDDRKHLHVAWKDRRPETAHLECQACGCDIEERFKTWMLSKGEWRATVAGSGLARSYHLPGMYSPFGWLTWEQMAREWFEAIDAEKRGDFTLLQAFNNLRLGQTWEERGESLKADSLLRRAQIDKWVMPGPVPNGVGVLVGSVDVQGDRLEVMVTGYGAGEESWVIDWKQIFGDPEQEKVWLELDKYLLKSWQHESGRMMSLECVTVDSGGHHAEKVYSFCKVRVERSVFAVKGGTELARPLVERPSLKNRYRTPLFILCVDSGKDRVYSRLRITGPGPGYVHLPLASWMDEEFVAQLTAERKVRKYVKGKGSIPFWKKLRERNEALDLTVYALAALYILGQDFIGELVEAAERWAKPLADGESGGAPAQLIPQPLPPATGPLGIMGNLPRPGGGWIGKWGR
jgi:phage terminase large subunit GpA-like protein